MLHTVAEAEDGRLASQVPEIAPGALARCPWLVGVSLRGVVQNVRSAARSLFQALSPMNQSPDVPDARQVNPSDWMLAFKQRAEFGSVLRTRARWHCRSIPP